MRIKKNLFLIAAPVVSSILIYKWPSWKTALVKALIKRRVERDNLENILRNYPDPPKSLLRKHAFDKIDIKGARGYWINKEKANNGVLIYLHGGGYYFGPLEVQWKYIARMSKEAGMAAVVIDYKLAPKHPFPEGLHDVETIISTLQGRGELPENYYLIGDSAGGGLAVAVTNQLVEKSAPLPQKLILISPWLDLSTSNPAIKFTADKDIMLSVTSIKDAARKYVQEKDYRNPLVSPLYGNVKGLPPILIQIGTSEIFLWDNRKFVQKLMEADVAVEYEEYEGMFHVFALIPELKEGKRAMKSQLKFLRA